MKPKIVQHYYRNRGDTELSLEKIFVAQTNKEVQIHFEVNSEAGARIELGVNTVLSNYHCSKVVARISEIRLN